MDNKHRRQYRGEEEAAVLVDWLNYHEQPGGPPRLRKFAARAEWLIESLRQLREHTTLKQAQEINEAFYKWCQMNPWLKPVEVGGGRVVLRFGWLHDAELGQVGLSLVRLGEMDVVHQIRRCRVPAKGEKRKCGKWFFSIQRAEFCSKACSKWFYASSEAYKAERREQKRRFRANERIRDLGFEKPAKLWKGR